MAIPDRTIYITEVIQESHNACLAFTGNFLRQAMKNIIPGIKGVISELTTNKTFILVVSTSDNLSCFSTGDCLLIVRNIKMMSSPAIMKYIFSIKLNAINLIN
jgi:hypothetical protein